MPGPFFRRDNHYVPRAYLKRWASSDDRVWTYRTLVADPSVPHWKKRSIGGIAYHAHLYTRLVAGAESDEVEEWLATEFESPAREPLEKAVTGARLTPHDWHCLVRFLALQDIRTPANLLRYLEYAPAMMQRQLDESLRKTVRNLETGTDLPKSDLSPKLPHAEYIPLRVTTTDGPGEEQSTLMARTVVGRSSWLFQIRHLLAGRAIKALHKHRWTILVPPEGVSWFTSDDPVVKLNLRSATDYDFGGGWGSPGTRIFLPLDAHHLLYTHVGTRPPLRGSIVSAEWVAFTRRVIAEHAHRLIFAASQDPEVPQLKPRCADAKAVQDERDQWERWHERNLAAERDLGNAPDEQRPET